MPHAPPPAQHSVLTGRWRWERKGRCRCPAPARATTGDSAGRGAALRGGGEAGPSGPAAARRGVGITGAGARRGGGVPSGAGGLT